MENVELQKIHDDLWEQIYRRQASPQCGNRCECPDYSTKDGYFEIAKQIERASKMAHQKDTTSEIGSF